MNIQSAANPQIKAPTLHLPCPNCGNGETKLELVKKEVLVDCRTCNWMFSLKDNNALVKELDEKGEITFIRNDLRHFINETEGDYDITTYNVSDVLEDRFERKLIDDLEDKYQSNVDVIDGGVCEGNSLDAVTFL